MWRSKRLLAIGEHLLEEFLSRTQSREDDFYIVFRQPRETDHVAREIDDAHRFAHVEHENLAAGTHGAGLQHQLRRLRNGHEETGDVGMGYRHRAARGDLFAEFRNDADGTAEHVAESNHHEARAMRTLQGLADHFRKPLARPHDIGWIDRLVG